MTGGVPVSEIGANRLSGSTVGRTDLQALFEKVREIPLEERAMLTGLDEGRARVIVAGILIVLETMIIVGTDRLRVVLCDLLEGALMQGLEEERNEHDGCPIRLYL
jgi:exopolyphosphatase/guanosine-5'-triphosphate,3'-diphosphate pyrophosphatase